MLSYKFKLQRGVVYSEWKHNCPPCDTEKKGMAKSILGFLNLRERMGREYENFCPELVLRLDQKMKKLLAREQTVAYCWRLDGWKPKENRDEIEKPFADN